MTTLDTTTTTTEANTTPKEDPFYGPDDAARYVGVSTETIRRAYRTGRLQTLRMGRLVRMRRSWIDAWAEAGAPTT